VSEHFLAESDDLRQAKGLMISMPYTPPLLLGDGFELLGLARGFWDDPGSFYHAEIIKLFEKFALSVILAWIMQYMKANKIFPLCRGKKIINLLPSAVHGGTKKGGFYE